MMLLCGLAGGRTASPSRAQYWQRLEAHAGVHRRRDGRRRQRADDRRRRRCGDGAPVARRHASTVYRSLLASGGRAVRAQRLQAPRRRPSTTRGAGCSATAGERPTHALPEAPRRAARAPRLPEGGYWILGERLRPRGEVRVLVDCGAAGLSVDRGARPCGRAGPLALHAVARNCWSTRVPMRITRSAVAGLFPRDLGAQHGPRRRS